jgi:hypothetical protein
MLKRITGQFVIISLFSLLSSYSHHSKSGVLATSIAGWSYFCIAANPPGDKGHPVCLDIWGGTLAWVVAVPFTLIGVPLLISGIAGYSTPDLGVGGIILLNENQMIHPVDHFLSPYEINEIVIDQIKDHFDDKFESMDEKRQVFFSLDANKIRELLKESDLEHDEMLEVVTILSMDKN